MNFNYNTVELMGANDNDDTKYFIEEIEKVLSQYPKGSGRYAMLMMPAQDAEAYLQESYADISQTAEGQKLEQLVIEIRNLLANEQIIAGQQQIKAGNATEADEAKKRLMFEKQRFEAGVAPIHDIEETIKIAEGNKTVKGGLTGILAVVALATGAYFVFKG